MPLNIFEKRYIELVNDSMKGQRLFGMIQPKLKVNSSIKVYEVGCLGKIISFDETNDRRFIIRLSGISRFKIKKELTTNKLYREFEVDYSKFADDLNIINLEKEKYNEQKLLNKINLFFKRKNYLLELNELKKLNFDQLISTICMISPFSIEEKQKLIETIKLEDKIKILEEIIDFDLLDNINTEVKTIQ